MKIKARPLTPKAFAPFGQVLLARRGRKANQGTARRADRLARLTNRRAKAQPNLAVFRVKPAKPPVAARLMERHPFSSQAFIPMTAKRYLVIVAPDAPGGGPDLERLAAFVARAGQGINYDAGVWHHPLTGLDAPADFAMLAWEDGGPGDCEQRPIPEPVLVEL